MRSRYRFRGFNKLDQQDKILLGLSAILIVGGVYLAKFAPDPETLHGLSAARSFR